MFSIVTATHKIKALTKRIRAVSGGTGASKTISILIYLISLAQLDEKPTLTSVVSESFPHLKRGAMKDFLDIMQTHNYFQDKRWNKSDFTYTFDTGSKIEFFSADQPGKVRGPRRDRLFLNEANNIPYETFDQLEIRTNEFIFMDWNPVAEFWFYDEVKHRDDVDFITLNYKHNEALPETIVKTIESRMGNKNWWQVYGLGLLGEPEGRIYSNWQTIDEIPHEARLVRYGLNFGYSLHPAAVVAVYTYNQGLIIDEVLYGLGYSNRQIADVFKNIQPGLICADSAEPKSIDELKQYGLNIIGVQKGKDSVRHGIHYVQDQKVSITKSSINIIKEYRNYMWLKDKNGRNTFVPEEPFHYGMDAVRYGIVGAKPSNLFDDIASRQKMIALRTKKNLTQTSR
jgi:phage terminase large subunit